MKRLWKKLLSLLKAVIEQLKDRTNIVIFIVVFLVLSSEVWVPILLGIITQNACWYGVGATCWAFWLAPFTPFLPLCFGLTFAVRKAYDALKKRSKKNKQGDDDNSVDNSKNNPKNGNSQS